MGFQYPFGSGGSVVKKDEPAEEEMFADNEPKELPAPLAPPFIEDDEDDAVAELTGDKKVVNITFADAVVDPDYVETLQDMTVQALNDALGQIDEATKKSMGAFAGKLPF